LFGRLPGMGNPKRHYERAFEAYLIRSKIPHVMVDEARRAVLPPGSEVSVRVGTDEDTRLKSFDAVVYNGGERGEAGPHHLVEVKGRRVDLRRGGAGRRECWATMADVEGLSAWERVFGPPFEGVLLFWYWLDGPVLNAMERETFRFEGRVYAHRAVRVGDYARLMRVRSPKWGTVNLATADFEAVGVPLGSLIGADRDGGLAGGVRASPVAAGAGGA